MVLESLIGPKEAERRPYEMFLFGILYSSIAIVLGLWIFNEQASLIMVFLTVLAATPLMYRTIRYEEFKDEKISSEKTLLKEHWKALSFFLFLFLGFIVSFSLWYIFLPSELVSSLFSTQIDTIRSINSQIVGNAIVSGVFMQILSNNLKVFLFCIFFSFFYGSGAIFILTWNASVIAGAVGNFVRNNLSSVAGSFNMIHVASYFNIISIGLLKYLTHGVFEILAYFIGGLAGGIISVAVIRHDVYSKEFRHVVYDSLDLAVLAIVLLIIGAIVEVYVTPALF